MGGCQGHAQGARSLDALTEISQEFPAWEKESLQHVRTRGESRDEDDGKALRWAPFVHYSLLGSDLAAGKGRGMKIARKQLTHSEKHTKGPKCYSEPLESHLAQPKTRARSRSCAQVVDLNGGNVQKARRSLAQWHEPAGGSSSTGDEIIARKESRGLRRCFHCFQIHVCGYENMHPCAVALSRAYP